MTLTKEMLLKSIRSLDNRIEHRHAAILKAQQELDLIQAERDDLALQYSELNGGGKHAGTSPW